MPGSVIVYNPLPISVCVYVTKTKCEREMCVSVYLLILF